MPNVNLVVVAVTAAGRLSLAVEYVENNIDNQTMGTINETALGLLLNARWRALEMVLTGVGSGWQAPVLGASSCGVGWLSFRRPGRPLGANSR